MGSDPPLSGSPATLDPALALLGQAARELGLRAWVVGGYVRDRLLGRVPHELDVVVEGDALRLAERFAQLAGARRPVLFPRFGTAQVTWQGRLVEFATARAESYSPDSRKPEVRPATLEEDLLRRDFTVNAILMDFEGQIDDPLGGVADLERRLLRTPRDPLVTFKDDPLRMLRAIRLAVQLGFELDPSLLPAMQRLRERARPPVLSVERVNEELRKAMVSEDPRRALELLDAGGLMEMLMPEVFACHGVEQGGWHTHDVFGHTLETVQHTEPDLVLRLAALFHDVGKPPTATPDGAVRRLARDAGPLLPKLLALARADIAASAYPHGDKLDELEERLRSVLSEAPSRMQIPVTGRDIMAVRGIEAGPEVGRLKARLEELVLEGTLPPEREALLAYLRDQEEP
jgi:tRNA nucleotidyltransferase/poly(A) polymerase